MICSDIGGMAEHVGHQVNGLHFRVGEPGSLAATIESAAPAGPVEPLHAGIPHVRTIDDHVHSLEDLYRQLIERRRATTPNGRAPAPAAAPARDEGGR